MLERHLKWTCTEMTILINQEGSCTESLSSATQPLWSPPVPRAHTQLRLRNKAPAASPQLPHAMWDISNPKIQLLGASNLTTITNPKPTVWWERHTQRGELPFWWKVTYIKICVFLGISIWLEWTWREAEDGQWGRRWLPTRVPGKYWSIKPFWSKYKLNGHLCLCLSAAWIWNEKRQRNTFQILLWIMSFPGETRLLL